MKPQKLFVAVASVFILVVCDVTFGFASFYGGTDKSPFYRFKTTSCTNILQTRLSNQFPTKRVTTDTCLMVYENLRCDKSGWSLKVMPPGVNFEKEPKSFEKCEDSEDNSGLGVTINKYIPDEWESQLERYWRVCYCINVPEYIQNIENWLIGNNGNELLAFFETDCLQDKWKPLLIEGGHFLESKEMSALRQQVGKHEPGENRPNKILSFGPNPNASYFKISCISSERNMAQNYEYLQLKQNYEMLKEKLEILNRTGEAQIEEVKNKVLKLEPYVDKLQVNITHSLQLSGWIQ